MKKYLIRSLLQVIPVLFLISLIVFVLVHVTGDPVTLMLSDTATDEDRAILIQALGLDQPLYVQYFKFLGHLVQGDFGNSFRYQEPALPIVLERLPASFELAIASMVVATVIAIPFGILSATKRNSFLDIFVTGSAVLGKAMPSFWLGIMLILLFSVKLGLLPVSGEGTFAHLILPAITLGTGIAAEMTRLIRSSMLEILQQDYIRTARSKGLSERLVVYRHAFRNSLIPVITIMALQTSHLIGGTLITETVFSWPGMGKLLIDSIINLDRPVVVAYLMLIVFFLVMLNLIVDIIYTVLDPRVRLEQRA